ncbi:MAG: phosphoglucosamine mutase, partial [Bacteroidetes bacterium]|nr:phosphoglucosamine mutase [Bacteroidota bacterium]
MSLIKSISGIRGTIGGKSGTGLSPEDIVRYVAAYASRMKEVTGKKKMTILVGRDARLSGDMVNNLVKGALQSMGVNVVDLGMTTTPTVEMAVTGLSAQGGIILTASHNPSNWNALKFLNGDGEFISAKLGEEILQLAESGEISYTDSEKLGTVSSADNYIDNHIASILALPLVDVEAIRIAEM